MQPTPYPKTGIWCPESNGYVERIVKSLMVFDAKPRLLESKKFSLSNLNLFMYLAVGMLILLIFGLRQTKTVELRKSLPGPRCWNIHAIGRLVD